MNNTTGCDVNQTTITSEITISQQTFYLVNQNFQVFSQLSYLECDNIYTSLPEGYFTNNVSDSPTADNSWPSLLTSWPVVGGAVGGGVLLIVIVIIIVVVVKRRRQTKNKNGSKEILSERPRRESPMIIDEVVDYISGDDLLPVVYATVNKDKTNKKSINGGQLTSGASVSVYEDLSKKTFGFGARPGNTNITSEGANVGNMTPYLPERPAPEERTNGVNYTTVDVNNKNSNKKSSNQPRVEAVHYSVTDSDLQFDPHH